MSKTTKTMWFITTSFYNQYDEYQTKLLRGYQNEAYAKEMCDRLMKYWIDNSKWEATCREYLNKHPEVLAIDQRDNAYPETWRRLEKEWKKANPFTTTGKRHDNNYFVTEALIKIK